MNIRIARAADAEAMQVIYAHHVLHGLGSFEEVPPTAEEMAGRLRAVQDRGLPWLVAERGGAAIGFAYAGPFRARSAYRYTAEDSVYVDRDWAGRGVGKALLNEVVGACERLGLRRLVAVIGDSGNAGSIALHRACGFEPAGVLPGMGWKAGRWLDLVFMHRALNGGAEGAPPPG